MTEQQFLKPFQANAGSLEELQALLSSGMLPQSDEQKLRAHIVLTKVLKQLPIEQVPETLRASLYALEQPTPGKQVLMIASDMLHPVLFIAFGITGFVIVNTNSISFQFSVLSTIVLSTAFGGIFYDLFKPRFFSV
ncbi:MAG: hypothetical protein WCX28_00080 [Bacteriovoracaceae bacterium]|nr:hypothetical protein [Bacteroidota bacterium]